jgi:hypothetical protein
MSGFSSAREFSDKPATQGVSKAAMSKGAFMSSDFLKCFIVHTAQR